MNVHGGSRNTGTYCNVCHNPDRVSNPAADSTARRPIVENAKCQACHVALGVAPAFHAGQRNDGPTCSPARA